MYRRYLLPSVGLAFAGLTIFLGYFVERSDFQAFILAYAAFFGLYAWLVFSNTPYLSRETQPFFLPLGLLLRALLLFSMPALSDDYARFLWDGHLTVNGYHPFAHPPDYFMVRRLLPAGIANDLFLQLNSPAYFSVYPPVCQAIFAIAAWCVPKSIWGGVVVIKLFLLAFELGTIRLLQRHVGYAAAFCYALNPLVILEISGNCHFEGAMIFFLLAGLIALQQNRLWPASGAWALAIASKMLPLLFLPLVWRYLGGKKGIFFLLQLALFCLLLFAPILWALPNILESLDLYFRQFQFNASIYYLVREVGYAKIGWDIGEFSGPILGAVTLLGICVLSIRVTRQQNAGLWSNMLFALFLYLSCAATVQPWYGAVPLALSLLTRWRFPIVWSGLIVLSYSHYENGGFQENYTLIALEYLVLWVFLGWEWWNMRNKVQSCP
ncbi:MAG: hypothetical protein SFV22_12055 [Saprospiraceae bacterium]|nr:hypothetical protein [Saprospiraceae bacterium]